MQKQTDKERNTGRGGITPQKGLHNMKVWEVVRVIDAQNEIGECVDAYQNYMEASERAAMLNSGTDETFIVIAEYI